MNLEKLFSSELKEKVKEAQRCLMELMESPEKRVCVDSVFRIFHTLKGSSSVVGFRNFQKMFHRLEDIVKGWRGTTADVKVVGRISKVLDLVVSKTSDLTEDDMERIEEILRGKEKGEEERIFEYSKVYKDLLEKVIDYTVELESHLSVGKIEMALISLKTLRSRLLSLYEDLEYVPMSDLVSGFDRTVLRDAVELGKKAKLVLDVEGAKVSRSDAHVLRDCLIHMIRNAIVHGIESPEERVKAGKDEVGVVKLKAKIVGEVLEVIVEDDGRGIDKDAVLSKAKQLGIEGSDPYQVIFYPQFSTLDKANMKAGRGVGLDAVKNFIEMRGGSIEVESEVGKFTRFRIKLPLEKYLKKVLLLKRSGYLFALEVSDVSGVENNFVVFEEKGKAYVACESGTWELKDLGSGKVDLVVVCKGAAVAVDEVLGLREAPIRSSRLSVAGVKGFLTGIEKYPVPVLDPSELGAGQTRKVAEKLVMVVEDSPLTRMVIEKTLEKEGYHVVGCSSVKQALVEMDRAKVDAAIVDINLPDGKGFEIVENLRKRFSRIPIVILSTERREDIMEDVVRSGADAVVEKSEDLGEVLEFLRGKLS